MPDPTMVNLGRGAVAGLAAGVPIGVLSTLLKRKMDNESLNLRTPEEAVSMPIVKRPPPPEKKKKIPMSAEKTSAVGNIPLSQVLGFGTGTAAAGLGTYSILSHLYARKDQRHLDMALKQREDRLNQLLLQEQAAAAGLPKEAVALVKRASDHRRAIHALEKIASNLYDQLEKSGGNLDRPVGTVMKELIKHIQEHPALGLSAAASMPVGAYIGYRLGIANDPNTLKAQAIKNSLKERLTGKDNLVGPMPLRVEPERLEMQPLKPGASSLVDPTQGRDVLEGI